MSQPSEDDYKEWLGHPVTEWVLGRLLLQAEQQKELWAEMAWQGNLDPLLHREALVRADCYKAIAESTYEDLHDTED